MAVNHDLQRERQCASFNPDDLTAQIYGRERMYARRLARKYIYMMNDSTYGNVSLTGVTTISQVIWNSLVHRLIYLDGEDNKNRVNHFILATYVILLFRFTIDKRACEDEAFKVAEKFVCMDRDDTYDNSVRIFTELVKKAQEYGYESEESDGLTFFKE